MSEDAPKGPMASEDPVADEGVKLLVKGIGVLVILLLVLLIVSSRYRPQLEAIASGFIARFGIGGMFVGTFLADALHFPVPPQFYLLVTVSSRCPLMPALLSIILSSLLGGATGYAIGGWLSRRRIARRWFRGTQGQIARLFHRYHYFAVVIGGIGPIPYSTLCQTAGFYHMPLRLFFAFVVLRIPRLLIFYGLIRLGWG